MVVWMVIVYNIYNYVQIYKKLKLVQRQHGIKDDSITSALKYFPLILIICWLPGSLNRILGAFTDPAVGFYVFHSFFACISGFLNSLAYGFNASVRESIKNCICRKKPTKFQDDGGGYL
jgi:hypothetical protein